MQTADACFRIPMVGMTRSLNLSVAAALIAERASARRRRILGAPGDLDEATQLRLRARFYAGSVRGAEAVLGGIWNALAALTPTRLSQGAS